MPKMRPKSPILSPRVGYMKGHKIEMVSFSLLSTKAAAESDKTVSQRRLGFTVTMATSSFAVIGATRVDNPYWLILYFREASYPSVLTGEGYIYIVAEAIFL